MINSSQSIPGVAATPTAAAIAVPMNAATRPTTNVSQIGIFCLPGRTRRPKAPMTRPMMMAEMIPVTSISRDLLRPVRELDALFYRPISLGRHSGAPPAPQELSPHPPPARKEVKDDGAYSRPRTQVDVHLSIPSSVMRSYQSANISVFIFTGKTEADYVKMTSLKPYGVVVDDVARFDRWR